MAEKPKKDTWWNKRNTLETFFTSHHLTLRELKENGPDQYQEKCMIKEIPPYPRPELHLTHLSHSTDLRGLKGIKQDGGFRGFRALSNPTSNQVVRDPDYVNPKLVWFFLTVTPADLRDAENRDMKIVHPDRDEETITPQQLQGAGTGILQTFASSPAFSSRSRYGSYRFTFSLRDVLDKYSRQFCGGKEPVMRKWKTIFYIQEVVYVVLVHPPTNQRFSNLPLLPTNQESDPICEFREDHFVWRPQAMSETHRYWINNGRVEMVPGSAPYYVWDNVAVALLLDGPQTFEFEPSELRQNLRFCVKQPMNKGRQPEDENPRLYEEAQAEVNQLWPPQILQKFAESDFHITD